MNKHNDLRTIRNADKMPTKAHVQELITKRALGVALSGKENCALLRLRAFTIVGRQNEATKD